MLIFLWATSSFQKITTNFKVFPNLVTLHTSHGNFYLTGHSLDRVFKEGLCVQFCCYEAKQPNLNLKTSPKPGLGHLSLDITLPVQAENSKPFPIYDI